MKKRAFHSFIVAFMFLFAGIKAEAQSTDNQTGYPVVSKNYVDVEGSPYLVDDFYKGSIKLSNGLTYKVSC